VASIASTTVSFLPKHGMCGFPLRLPFSTPRRLNAVAKCLLTTYVLLLTCKVGQNHIYIRCVHGCFGSEITKYTVIYGVDIRFWPTLLTYCVVDKVMASLLRPRTVQRRHLPTTLYPLYTICTLQLHCGGMCVLVSLQCASCWCPCNVSSLVRIGMVVNCLQLVPVFPLCSQPSSAQTPRPHATMLFKLL